jgi:TRAP-type uncharacterized transport system substrate-binding protein
MIGKVFPLGFFRLLQAIAATLATVTIAAMLLPAAGFAGDEMFASVGTGQVNGIYYPVGKAICQVVDRNLRTKGSAARLKPHRDRSTT